jgi:hypothetical protein
MMVKFFDEESITPAPRRWCHTHYTISLHLTVGLPWGGRDHAEFFYAEATIHTNSVKGISTF